jgi:thiosulfate/3-mercaptopyruvate sulfurtransferase
MVEYESIISWLQLICFQQRNYQSKKDIYMMDALFVSTQWLDNHLDSNHLRIVDIRGHVLPASEPPPHYYSHGDDYNEAHIPGAVFIDWTEDIVEPGSPSYDIASPLHYAALMSRLGIGNDMFVVAYDDANGMFASRFWWTMKYYGHDPIAVLAGGWNAWTAEGRPVTNKIPDITPAEFTPAPQPDLLATGESIADRLQSSVLIDVRSPDQYTGKTSRVERKGRIPGALNVPIATLLDDNGNLKSPDELKAIFNEAGVSPDAENVVIYCNAGVSASLGLMALETVGIRGRLYDGSWRDWATDASKPVESGEDS